MRHAEFTLKWRQSLGDYPSYSGNVQEDQLRAVINLIQEDGGIDDFEVVATDYHILPSSYRPFAGEGASRINLAETLSGGPPRITHPWDQGAWIFPEDHPLRPYEEKAKQGDEAAQQVLDRSVEAVKQLNP